MPSSAVGPNRVPLSTYRVQLHAGFGFRDATALVPYLSDLGIDYLYTSPILKARPGSTHGYDVVDPTQLNPEIGTPAEFEQLVEALRGRGMGLLLDVVPNHMGAHPANPWWLSVLEQGRRSPYAKFFDIDWGAGSGKLLLPVLGDDLGPVIERGELVFERAEGRGWLRYFEARFPLDPATLPDGGVQGADAIRSLHAAQAYELRRWNSEQPLNYRRFFSISELVGLRVEDPEVFEESHRLLLEMVSRGQVQGLRIDHPDGLLDPDGYFRRLQEACRARLGASASDGERPFYVIVEKILTGHEPVREAWPIHGGTGYQQMNVLGGVFVDRSGGPGLRALYERVTRSTRRFIEVVRESKRCVMDGSLEAELATMTLRLRELVASDPGAESLQLAAIREGLREVIACFPVYRTYVAPDAERVEGEDRRIIEQALGAARAVAPELPEAVHVLLRSVLLLEPPVVRDAESLERCRRFLLRFQQTTGPAAAKGVEDTTFYRYAPLLSLNEVGGEPDEFGLSVEDFHTRNAERARRFPYALTATSTHDTKRSEDVRSRITTLSEIHHDWGQAVERWQAANAWAKQAASGITAPDANDEYLLYQTLVGAWPQAGLSEATGPEFRERIRSYMLKAVREEKRITRWIAPNTEYERVVSAFVDAVLDRARSEVFLSDLDRFQARVAQAGYLGSLSLVLLKAAGPGVPDFYQGCEDWDFSLVDPDNRRPVDFGRRQRLLAEIAQQNPSWSESLSQIEDGRLKLLVTTRCLHLRQRRDSLFKKGDYLPSMADGARAEQVIAFARSRAEEAALAIATRFFTRFEGASPVGDVWSGTLLSLPDELPAGRYRDVFTGQECELRPGEKLDLAVALAHLPVSLLERMT